jgi:uncharacterized membrane protein YccC
MKNQHGHMDFIFIYWIAGIAGVILAGGGAFLIWLAVQGLR